MTRGTWGSRIPVGNFLISRLLFLATRWRIRSRRFLNGRRRPVTVRKGTPAELTTAVRQWLDGGYNKFNIGGGVKNLRGFVNVDFIPHAGVEREIVADINDLAFMPSSCASHIHSNHVLEHMAATAIPPQLGEYHRILRKGGLLTVRCPNALGAAYGFWFAPIIEEDREEFVALGFPPEEDLANPADAWMHRDVYGVLHWFHGDMGNIENEHLVILTPTTLRHLIEGAGFTILKMAAPEAVNLVVIARKEED